MFNQLETALNINLDQDRQVNFAYSRNHRYLLTVCYKKTVMTVVQELDKSLFDSYVKPKSALVCDRLRRGILDSAMDWYKTSPPKGIQNSIALFVAHMLI
jgi:hypothetical protein